MGDLPSFLSPLLEDTPGTRLKLLAAWDGLPIDLQIGLLDALGESRVPRELALKALGSQNAYVRYLAASRYPWGSKATWLWRLYRTNPEELEARVEIQRSREAERKHLFGRGQPVALDNLTPGDYVVHVERGAGIYRGLRQMYVGGTTGDYLHLEFAGGDRLYVPVDRIDAIRRHAELDVVLALDVLADTPADDDVVALLTIVSDADPLVRFAPQEQMAHRRRYCRQCGSRAARRDAAADYRDRQRQANEVGRP